MDRITAVVEKNNRGGGCGYGIQNRIAVVKQACG